jgi:uncharacterized protein (DUF1810 family)
MLKQFLDAQDNGVYDKALSEIRAGAKQSHWIWFVFPQIAGLGSSHTTQKYAIPSFDTARQYFLHPILGSRLIEISTAVYNLNAQDINKVLPYPDNLKFKSCMTLFSIVAPECDIFQKNLDRYFHGAYCRLTRMHYDYPNGALQKKKP